MQPVTVRDWLTVARERGSDAEAMMPERSTSSGPVYMAGYAIECSLKAYLRYKGIRFPTRGSGGHDLKELWRASCFRLSDLGDNKGSKTFYIEVWTTDFRYESALETGGLTNHELLDGAKSLVGWIQTRMRRPRSKK